MVTCNAGQVALSCQSLCRLVVKQAWTFLFDLVGRSQVEVYASIKAHFPSAQASIQVDHVLVNVESKWAALPGPGCAVFSRQDGLTKSASDLRYEAGCSSLDLSLYLSRPRLISHHRLDSAFQFEKWKSSKHICADHGLHSLY